MAIVRLARRLSAYRRDFVIVVIASAGVLVVGVVVATLSVASASALAGDRSFVMLGAGLAVGVVVAAVLTWTEQWVAHVLAYRVIDALRVELHRSLARLAPLGLARRSTGDTVARAIGDAEALEWFYAHTAAQVVAGALASLALSTAAVVVAGPAGLIVPLSHALIILIPVATAAAAKRQGDAVRGEIAELSSVALAARQYARETVLLGRLGSLAHEVADRTGRIQRARRSIALRLGFEQAAYETVGAALTMAALALAVSAVTSGTAPQALAPVAIVFAASSSSAALVISAAIGRIGEVRAAAARINELLEAPGVRPKASTGPHDDADRAQTHDDAPGVEVSGLRVSYPGGGVDVLAGVDLVVPRGTMLAIVGASGAGKSTLLLALSRLIPTTGGEIRIDGSPIDRERPAGTRNRISLVGQHAHVFRSTVRDNLLAPDATTDEAWRALDSALLGELVRGLPEGLDTLLDESGAGWSGGERQRLGLARGLIRNASVLLLDEPTAGLDPAAESLLLETLRAVKAARTIIVVTHREAVMRASDSVALLDRGHIVDVGPHDELLSRVPQYRSLLAQRQSQPPG